MKKELALTWLLLYLLGHAQAQNINKIEYFFNSDPGYGAGTDVPVTLSSTITDLSFNADISALSAGFNTLNVRARDANGTWGIAQVKSIYVQSAASLAVPNIAEVEYFLDADPGFGNGVDVTITPAVTLTDVNFAIDLTPFADGFHTLNIRAKDANGRWGATQVKPVFKLSASPGVLSNITKIEYFFDADPGYGGGVDVPVTAGTTIIDFSFTAVTSTLTPGFHTFNVRTRDANGVWSTAHNKPVYMVGSVTEPTVVALEYFFDTDPGVGNGTALPLSPAINFTDYLVGANISALAVGPHLLYVRARDSNGMWSTTESYPFEACIQAAPVAGPPLGLSYDTFVANWTAAVNAVTYQLDISTDTLATFLPGYQSKSLTVLRDTLAGLTPLTHFQYRVRALGPDNCLSINSDTIYVRTNSTLAIDTDALIAFYNATSGANWTNKTGWTTGLASNSWFGVTVVNENVVAVDLSSNNLQGTVPTDVLNVSLLTTFDLAGNGVSSVPDFSGLPKLTSVDISNNKLDFGDLEYNLDVPGINFANQKDIGLIDSDTVNIGNQYSQVALVGGTANQYQWKQNGTNLLGAVQNTYSIPSFSRNDRGDYECVITSTLVPGLTLKTATKTLVGVASIAGTLYAAPGSPATVGTVQLLKITSGGYDSIPVIPLPVNSDGTFVLNKILLDDYLLVGLADTNTYVRALPTYLPGTAYWEEADTIALEVNISGLNIVSVLEPTDQLTGEGLLFGIVQEDDGTGGRVEKTSRVGGAGVSARRSQGTGRGEEVFEIVGYVFTNENGEFSIEGLPAGEYRFNVQYPGYPMDEETFIDFIIGTNALEETVQVEATVEGENIKVRELVITNVIERKEYVVEVSPNPSRENLKIEFTTTSNERFITLRDGKGLELVHQKASSKELFLDTSTLPSGMYLLTVVDKGQAQKIVKVIKQ